MLGSRKCFVKVKDVQFLRVVITVRGECKENGWA